MIRQIKPLTPKQADFIGNAIIDIFQNNAIYKNPSPLKKGYYSNVQIVIHWDRYDSIKSISDLFYKEFGQKLTYSIFPMAKYKKSIAVSFYLEY